MTYELPRPNPVGRHQRREAPARSDHQNPGPGTPADCSSRPPGNYRRAPAKGQTLHRRQDGQPAHIIEISWQAQRRLYNVWQRLDTQRGKRRTIVAVAVARELAGFCWALANAA